MSWAARRRFIILLVVGAVVVAFLTVVVISALYKAPSCSDGVQNQGEAGIDCGGLCAYLCRELEQPPTVLFTKSLQNTGGRIDIVAEVENKNANAVAKNVHYKISVYDNGQKLLKEFSGVMDLPGGATVPVYVPGILAAGQLVTHAFLTIDSPSLNWVASEAGARNVPVVGSITQSGSPTAPRIDAILLNVGVTSFDNVRNVVFVRDANKEVIAASETVVRTIPAQGQATATFTWSTPFTSASISIEILPIIPLP